MNRPGSAALSAAPHPLSDEDRAAHVLVVDDEPTLRRGVARLLEARGMNVAVAEDGVHALEYIRRTPPDVALVDATMPGVSGLEVLAAVNAEGASCEVILMTASADVDSAVAAMKSGAYDVLAKPLHSSDAVAHAVAAAAEHRRLAGRARAPADPVSAMLVDLTGAPYAEAKRRLVALFDETYTSELLRRAGGNMSEAARRAGLDRSNFRRLLKRYKRQKETC